jgi:hypothetical protein
VSTWRRHRIDPLGLELEVLDGPPLFEEPGSVLQASDPLVLGVRYGDGATIEEWRERFAAWPPVEFGPVTETGAGRRLEAAVVAGVAEALLAVGVHRRVEEPARTVIALGFTLGGVPVLAHWSVPTERRDDYAEKERRFFDGATRTVMGRERRDSNPRPPA